MAAMLESQLKSDGCSGKPFTVVQVSVAMPLRCDETSPIARGMSVRGHKAH